MKKRHVLPLCRINTDIVHHYSLAAVNFFLAIVGIAQISRITMHNMANKDGDEAAVEAAVEAKVKA